MNAQKFHDQYMELRKKLFIPEECRELIELLVREIFRSEGKNESDRKPD